MGSNKQPWLQCVISCLIGTFGGTTTAMITLGQNPGWMGSIGSPLAVCAHMCVCVYVFMHIYMYVCMSMHIDICVCVYRCVYLYMYTYTPHTHTHRYIHTLYT
jgi:hypothetical protein